MPADRSTLPASLPPPVERFAVAPDTVTVLGRRWKATDAAWRGLDFANAQLRTQSTLMLYVCGPDAAPYDLHLNVPYSHPDDDPCLWEGAMYRVRPIAEPGKRWRRRMVDDVAIEPSPGKEPPWEIVVTFASSIGLSRGQERANG